jgi:transposase
MMQSKGHGEKFSRKQELAVLALITEPSFEAAAKKVGVSLSTLYKWNQREDFQELFRKAKKETMNQATAKLQKSTTLAIDTLNDVMANKKAPAMARVTAAKTVLEFAFKAVEIEEIQERLERIEKSLEEKDNAYRIS